MTQKTKVFSSHIGVCIVIATWRNSASALVLLQKCNETVYIAKRKTLLKCGTW